MIDGVNEDDIVNLKIEAIKLLKIKSKQKEELIDFSSKYDEYKNKEWVFLNRNREQKISKTIIRNIKKKYIK